MSSGESDLYDVTVQLHHETSKAILVSDSGDKEKAKWLPKSQIEITEKKDGGILVVTAPTWLLKDKGFL